MRMFAPLQYDPVSFKRNATPAAISSGSPILPSGILLKSNVGTTSATRSVFVIPGDTALIRIPCDASSSTAPA
eukprot:29049-Pelagococcus_subviridis.AAC.4